MARPHNAPLAITTGTRLGPYEILSAIGAGGMGEVYRARDSKLKRDVAIKVLPEAFARDPERLARFEREAEVLATLNHPNIAAVYGFDESTDANGIVLELVEGPTLADRIAKGPVPINEALPIAQQIVEAMIAAHEKGIIHRDLKPANIKVTSDGRVKVLDFGLAKATDSTSVSAINVTAMPTITSPAMVTGVGVVLGTAAYMSPEQARGRVVDARADIWAFGALLYEMLTGQRAFAGDDVTETIANIVKSEPDWSALPAETPVALRALLRRCLNKDPDRRLRHIADARFNLEDAETLALPAPRPSGPARVLPWAVAACSLVVAGAAWVISGRAAGSGDRDARSVVRLEVGLPDGVELFTSSARTIGVSPDGRRLAYIGIRSGSRQVYIRSLDQSEATPVRSSDGATAVFFSPDGQSIGLINAAGVLKAISLADGVSTTIAEDANFIYGGAWLPGDRIVFGRSAGGLWQVGRSGGTVTPLTKLNSTKRETIHSSPIPTPDGRALLFSVFAGDQWHVEAVVLATGERVTVLERSLLPLLATRGQLFFYRDGSVMVAPFDLSRLRVTGDAVRVVDAQSGEGGNPLFDMSAGMMVYPSTSAVSRLVWVSRGGVEQPMNDVPRSYATPRVSPDGTRVLVQASGLWIQDLARATFTKVVARDEQTTAFPIWTPDSRRIVVRGARGLTFYDADGSGRSDVVPGTSIFDYPGAIAPDNDTFVMLRASQETSFDIYALSLRDPRALRPILNTPAYEGGARLSPDGKWLSYVSNESGQYEVYVRPFSGMNRRWPVSTEGGTQAVWNPNGRELFYRNGNKMMAVDVTASPDLKLSAPHVLFDQRYAFSSGITIANYDVSRDGQRFLMVKNEAGASRLNVVLNVFVDAVK